jgi:hypothetical protein
MASILNSAVRPLSAVAATVGIAVLQGLTISGGDRIVVGVVFRGASAAINEVRVGGALATLIRAESGIGASNACLEIYEVRADQIAGVTGGELPIVVYLNGSQDRLGIVAWELDDTDQDDLPNNDTTGTGTAQNTSVTAIVNSSLLLGAAMVALSGSSYTAASGQSETDDSAAATGLGCVWGFEAGVSSGSRAWDWTCAVSGAWCAMAVAVAPRLQTITALDPADGATGVSPTIGQLELSTSATAVQGTGDFRIYERDDTKGAPTLTRANFSQTTASTTFAVPVPFAGGSGVGGTLAAGDAVLFEIAKDDDDSITALSNAGFSPLAAAFSGTAVRSLIMWRRCDGVTEPATVTITGDSEEWIGRSWHIPAADMHPTREPVVVYVSATTTAANPPGITPPWTGPTLYVANLCGDGNGSASAFPANADVGTTGTGVSSTAVWHAWAEHFSPTGGAFDFSAFTNSNLATVAYCIAVPIAEPSGTLIETVAASACTFGSGGVIVPIGTLSANTEYFVEFDRVLVGAPGEAKGRETWSFETGSASGSTHDAVGVASLSNTSTATLTQNHQLAGAGAQSLSSTVAPTLTQNHQLSAAGSESDTETGEATYGHVLAAAGTESDTETGETALTQNHQLAAAGASSTSQAGAAALSQNHQLAATGLVSASRTGTASLNGGGGGGDGGEGALGSSILGIGSRTRRHVIGG